MQRAVTLVRGSTEVELSLQQVNVQSLQRIFQVSSRTSVIEDIYTCLHDIMSDNHFQLEPTSIWLKEDTGNRALFPEPDGTFNMDSVVYHSFRVEGVVALPTGASEGPSTSSQSSVNVRTPSTGPPVFRSVTSHRSRRSDSLSAEQPTARVKIIKANLLTDTRGSATICNIFRSYLLK